MPKRKIGTVIDHRLYRQVKILAANRGISIAEVIDAALRQYVACRKRQAEWLSGLAEELDS